MSWFNKVEEKIEYDVCDECKHLIEKGSGQKIIVERHHRPISGHDISTKVYCELHKRPYDKIIHKPWYFYEEVFFFKAVEPWQEVDEKGKPIKATKKAK